MIESVFGSCAGRIEPVPQVAGVGNLIENISSYDSLVCLIVMFSPMSFYFVKAIIK